MRKNLSGVLKWKAASTHTGVEPVARKGTLRRIPEKEISNRGLAHASWFSEILILMTLSGA